ncbi:TPA: translation initiation factor IF-2, partial [candidate division WOR-3 bacterium]|nr:translation initiation factor IF-2 [candidate division WOR-3 bacterium]
MKMSEMQFNVLAKELGEKATDLIKAVNKKFKDANIKERAYTSKMTDEWIDYCRGRFAKHYKKETAEEQKAEATQQASKAGRRFVKIEKHIKEPPQPTEEELKQQEEERLRVEKEIEDNKKAIEKEKKRQEETAAKEKARKDEISAKKGMIEVKILEDKKEEAKSSESKDKSGQTKPDQNKPNRIQHLHPNQYRQPQQPYRKFEPKQPETQQAKPAFEEVKPVAENGSKIVTSEDIYSKKKKKKRKKNIVDKAKIAESVEKTLKVIRVGNIVTKKKHKEKSKDDETDAETKKIAITDYIVLSDLADKMQIDAVELIEKAIEMGIMVTINQRIDFENSSLLAMEFGFEVERIKEEAAEQKELDDQASEDEEYEKTFRPPIVTIMGHVDHGKTTLIDFLRKSRIVDTEHGRITQDIGAYTIKTEHGVITVIDTPGHEAFTAMRARGAQITDMAIIVIAANDGVMPQTIEAINHCKIANVPFIIAINKIDLPDSDIDKIKRQLLSNNVILSEFGGNIPSVNISAKTGKGVSNLIESILIQAELMDLKAAIQGTVNGTVIEVKQDKGLGSVINCIIQKGVLKKEQVFVVGMVYGRVRKMLNEFKEEIKEATPSMPVMIVGASGLPEVGDRLMTVADEKIAREIARKRHFAYKEQLIKKREITSLDGFEKQLELMKKKEIKLILKGKVYGAIEALADSLQVMTNDEVLITVIYKEVGIVTENDVNAAIASKAMIVAFNTLIDNNARILAKREGIIIKQYNIIYDVLDDVVVAIKSMNEPIFENVITGTAEVRQIFKISKLGSVAGLYVTEGHISRNGMINVLRKGEDIGTFSVKTLKRFKDDAKQVEAGFECAILLDGFDDFQ